MKAKRFTAIVLLVLLVAVLLAGCGSSVEGRYVIKSIGGKSMEDLFQEEAEESEMSLAELLEFFGIKNLEEYMVIELKDDGTATSTVALDDEVETGTWKQEGDKISVTIEGDTIDFTLSGKELSADIDGKKYVFVKK